MNSRVAYGIIGSTKSSFTEERGEESLLGPKGSKNSRFCHSKVDAEVFLLWKAQSRVANGLDMLI